MAENVTLVQKAFRILHPRMAEYIAQEMNIVYHDSWWQEVLMTLSDQTRDLPVNSTDFAEQVDSLDVANCLRLFDRKWNDIFRRKLSIDYRTWAKELMGIRHKIAYIGQQDYAENDTWRALDTMARLCEAFDNESAEEIRDMLRKFRYGSSKGSTAVTNASAPVEKAVSNAGVLQIASSRGLPSWRDVIEPHPDVAQGRYRNAEFAANLAQVSRGEGAFEYRDPVEFFARTYITEGMTGLLVQALQRVNGKGGEPVVQLKTAFGGGKTHTMLAIYHMMQGNASIEKLPNLQPVLKQAGVYTLPKANVAVLVGTSLDPSKSKRPINFPGHTINTIWGEMAYQLVTSAGKPELYELVKDSDKKGVSPGSEAIKNLFDACAPCVVLMDELVAYAKKIYGVDGLPAGSFDNFISFIQEITEAAGASKNSLVVASIPESNIEIGGEAGTYALETIEHTFGRMESIWKPVAANEGFEIVRRRLFLPCKDTDARNAVCNRFSEMYQENASDFPMETKEVAYRDRLVSCYPIHPEVFDRLYEDWSTLERFQRTRGVLRLMAAVIHELWMANDASAMIMPGSIPLDTPNVRDELVRYLSDNWNSIIDHEVDGKSSVPYQKDKSVSRYGQKLAARRVSRTIMLGSAPTTKGKAASVRGIETSRIRLGVVQPGENIADFNDALMTLQGSLSYLYNNPSGDRYWFDTRPTLRKVAEDRATQVASSDVEYEIEQRLRKLKKEYPFAGLHICPASSLDVTDDQAVRLVILRPEDTHRSNSTKTLALTRAEEILNNRGNSPRLYRNMLAFIAPDQEAIGALQQEVRRFIAWTSIKTDSESLNLDAAQNRETEQNLIRSNQTVDSRIKEAFCWLMVPYIDRAIDMKTIEWDISSIKGGDENIISKAAKRMQQNELLITKWAPVLLQMELDDVLWGDSDDITIKKLWGYLSTYCYLPRLASYSVLEDTIQNGLNSDQYFALAAGVRDGKYIDLKFNQYVGNIDTSDMLVKDSVALRQIAADQAQTACKEIEHLHKETVEHGQYRIYGSGYPNSQNSGAVIDEPVDILAESPKPTNTHFYMSAKLNTTRINRDVQRLVEEVISQLTSLDGASVKVSLEVSVDAPDGISASTVRAVSENCKTLKVDDFGFDS